MSKEYPEETLIALARKAKKVEPLPEGDGRKSAQPVEVNNVYEFFDALDVSGGRYEVKLTEIYNIYKTWDDTGTSYKKFRKKISDAVVVKGQYCKLNRKLNTIQQTYKELSNGKEEEE